MNKPRTIIGVSVIHALQQMKNPLTNIMLSMELISEEPVEEKKQAYYNTIRLSAARLEKTIREMCNFFKDLDSDAAAEHKSLTQQNNAITG